MCSGLDEALICGAPLTRRSPLAKSVGDVQGSAAPACTEPGPSVLQLQGTDAACPRAREGPHDRRSPVGPSPRPVRGGPGRSTRGADAGSGLHPGNRPGTKRHAAWLSWGRAPKAWTSLNGHRVLVICGLTKPQPQPRARGRGQSTVRRGVYEARPALETEQGHVCPGPARVSRAPAPVSWEPSGLGPLLPRHASAPGPDGPTPRLAFQRGVVTHRQPSPPWPLVACRPCPRHGGAGPQFED